MLADVVGRTGYAPVMQAYGMPVGLEPVAAVTSGRDVTAAAASGLATQ